MFSCVFGTASLAVARAALPHLKVGCVFADLTTADPEAVRLAAAEMAAAGVYYADITIMGAVAMAGFRAPLLCAGTGTSTLVPIFKQIGAPIRPLEGGKAGDPSALKILRSVFTKGLEALAVDCFVAAKRQRVTAQLVDALADIDQTPLRTFMEALIRTHVVHAPRRLREVEEAERQLRQANLPIAVLPAVRALFERTCADLKQSPPGDSAPTTATAFAWLLANAERHGGSPSPELRSFASFLSS